MKETTTMSDELNKEVLDRKMRQIESLLSRADHPSTPAAEATSARAMAERLMTKYRIEESELIASGDLKVNVITPGSMVFRVSPVGSEFEGAYASLASYAINHTGCKGVWTGWETDEGGRVNRCLDVIGYEADIRYAEMLFTNARMLFADRMEPKPDAALADEDNVYRMRSAGMERIRIASMMGWGTTGSATGKVTRMYKRACAARGEEPTLTGRGNSVVDFRTVYASEFVSTFWQRLWEARQAVDAEVQEGGLVLADRAGRVLEAMYMKYPSLRPDPSDAGLPVKAVKSRRRSTLTKADQARLERMNSKAGRAGGNAGRAAAQEVSIKGQTPQRRLDN